MSARPDPAICAVCQKVIPPRTVPNSPGWAPDSWCHGCGRYICFACHALARPAPPADRTWAIPCGPHPFEIHLPVGGLPVVAPAPGPAPLCAADIVTVAFTEEDWREMQEQARLAEIGGVSRVRAAGDDRRGTLTMDQCTGMLGHWALSMWAFGSAEPWREQRRAANAHPLEGDGGVDLVIRGRKTDVKTSEMRGPQDPLRYHLVVPPAERHADRVYVLALHPPGSYTVLLIGGVKEQSLPREPEAAGTFKGKYVLPATRLRPLRKETP